MARPRSEDKQLAILEAATQVVAERGTGGPTSQIAKLAGVSDGTLFRYFATKEELLNILYLYIKEDMSKKMSENYYRSEPLKNRVAALWNSYIDWGLSNPVANKAINQLSVSELIHEETHKKAAEFFPDMGIAEAFTGNPVFEGRPVAFSDAIFLALADTTMTFASKDESEADIYKACGFTALWNLIGRN